MLFVCISGLFNLLCVFGCKRAHFMSLTLKSSFIVRVCRLLLYMCTAVCQRCCWEWQIPVLLGMLYHWWYSRVLTSKGLYPINLSHLVAWGLWYQVTLEAGQAKLQNLIFCTYKVWVYFSW